MRLSGDLQAGLLCEKLLLTNQEVEKLDLLTVQCIVDIAQPLIFVLVLALRLVAKKQYGSAARAGGRLAYSHRESHPLRRVRTRVGIGVPGGLKQVRKEWAYGMPGFMLTLCVVAGHLRIVARQQQSYVLDRPRLADVGRLVDQRAHDSVAQTPDHQIIEGPDRRCRDAVVAGSKRMQRWIDRSRNVNCMMRL